jgi:hypothetical protein
MKVAVLTVFYPGMEEYIDEYYQCISSQTWPGVELVIVDDNCQFKFSSQASKYGIYPQVITSTSSPQLNRIAGLKYCYNQKYDIVVCSDSDETMHTDRVKKVVEYFVKNKNKQVVYNDSVASTKYRKFSLYYKDVICFDDIVDFNILGYGAMNCRREHIPFIVENVNPKVDVFDWWIALVYLYNHPSVDFLRDAKNLYRTHSNNYVGPALMINAERTNLSIKIKLETYKEMEQYSSRDKNNSKTKLFKNKINEILEIKSYIKKYGIGNYVELIDKYFFNKNIYWWQDVVSLDKLKIKEF